MAPSDDLTAPGGEGSRPEESLPAESRVRLVLWSGAGAPLLVAILFGPAGRLDWAAGWAYLALLVATVFVNYRCLKRWNPELIDRRLHLGDGTKTWDKWWAGIFSPLYLSVYVVAGLDAVRFGWSSPPAWLWPLGLAVFLPGSALLIASMVVNPFFEKTVRIQTERGHRVIDTGSYAFVRHPGYVGFLAWIVSAPLLLGSVWAWVPALLGVVGVVVRTALEDRTLRRELTGYDEYARRVPFRLIPGVW
jgi:protein-S-isoprenylcysteine O-methyltransferase Ste14